MLRCYRLDIGVIAALLLAQVTVTLQSEEIVLTPNVEELLINEGESLRLSCTYSKHLKFKYPETNTPRGIYTSEVKQREIAESTVYVYEFERPETVYGDTGWYGCVDFEEFDASPGYISPTTKWIYVYVKSKDHLFVQTYNPAEIGTMLTGVVSYGVTIPCRPTSPDLTVELYNQGVNKIDVNNGKYSFDPRFGFNIMKLTVMDTSFYICVIQHENMTEKVKYFLHIASKINLPTPLINEETLEHIVEGDTLHVNCSLVVASDALIRLNWTTPIKDKRIKNKSYSEVAHNSRKKVTLELIISDVTIGDEGNYTCTALHVNDYKSRSVFLKIYDRDTSYIYLTRDENDTYYIMNEGERVVWTVHVKAHPPANFMWLGPGGKEIKHWYDSDDAKYIIHNTPKKVTFAINKLTLNDAGNYTLQASNGYSFETLNYSLEVYAKPVVYIGDTHAYYTVNKIANFTCSIAAFPIPTIKWNYLSCPHYPSLKNSTLIDLHEFYTTTGYTKFESTVSLIINLSGIINCTACNEVDCDSSSEPVLVTDIHEGFGIENSIQHRIIIEGDDLEITCGASIYNYTDQINWYDESNKLIRETERIRLIGRNTPFSYQKILNITNVQLSDTALLTCRSLSKDLITEELQYQLVVNKARPVVITKTNLNESIEVDLNTYEQQVLYLQCIMDGLPFPNISWFKDDVPIKSNEQFEFARHNQELRIKYLFEKDSGLYKCHGYNRLNEQTVYTNIIVKGKSVSVTWIAAVILLIFICIGLIIFFSIRIHREKVMRKQLVEAGLMHFEEGAIECLNPELTVDDQADLLPYDKRYEFPRQRLKLGKQLGSGNFGVVMKAEAEGIIENQETTTVAVKMVRRSADPTNIRALVSELKIMIHLGKHLNVVNLLGACTNNIIKRELLVIVEYCRFGNLHNYLLKHRSTFINQIDPATGRLDVSIINKRKDLKPSLDVENYKRAKYAELSFSDSKSENGTNSQYNVNSGNSKDTETASNSLYVGTEEGNSRDLTQDNNSSATGWLLNYKGDYTDQNLEPICTQDLLSWAFQVARGMEYLSKRKVLHGDLAARNILLAENNVVKICDFGLAKTMYKDDNYKKQGNELLPIKWLAIESIRDQVFSTQSDVWSYGIVLWEFFTLANTPYPGIVAYKIYFKLIEGYRMEQPEYATKEIYDLMLQCWKAKPALRPSFTDLVDSIGDLLEDNVKSYYIDLNTPYLDMNISAQEGKEDYLKMVSAPDYALLSSPNHEYVNAPSVNALQRESYLRKNLDESGPKTAVKDYSSDLKNSDDIDETVPMLNDDDDNYLKPINIHEKRAEFVRQRQNKNKSDGKTADDSSYCNTPSNIRLIDLVHESRDKVANLMNENGKKMENFNPKMIKPQDNYINLPKGKSNYNGNSEMPDSFSNPTYIFMDTNSNVQSSEV